MAFVETLHLGEKIKPQIENCDWDWYKHDYQLMQYTGLKDKNGREIYDGDITIDANGTMTVIEYDEYRWIEKVIRLRDVAIQKDKFSFVKNNAAALKIIGNIYENPELLK